MRDKTFAYALLFLTLLLVAIALPAAALAGPGAQKFTKRAYALRPERVVALDLLDEPAAAGPDLCGNGKPGQGFLARCSAYAGAMCGGKTDTKVTHAGGWIRCAFTCAGSLAPQYAACSVGSAQAVCVAGGNPPSCAPGCAICQPPTGDAPQYAPSCTLCVGCPVEDDAAALEEFVAPGDPIGPVLTWTCGPRQ